MDGRCLTHTPPSPGRCHLCRLGATHPGYAKLWGLPVPAGVQARLKAQTIAAARHPCVFRGPKLDRRPCGVTLYPCSLYGDTTSGVTTCKDAQRRCAGCPGYQPAAPAAEEWPIRLDEKTLAPGVPGLRFNSSLIEWRDGYALAFRNGWRGSEIYVATLDRRFRPVGDSTRLQLRHRDANYGREDPRLFLHGGGLHVAFIGVVGGHRIRHTNQLFARLGDGFKVEDTFHPHYPGRNAWEKNWQFFDHGGDLYAVYSAAPRHRVLGVRSNDADVAYQTEWAPQWAGGEIRGGASPVRVGDEFWSFFHDRIEVKGHRVYRLGLYTFAAEPPFRPLRMIPDPLLTADLTTRPADQYASVIFPCGAVRDGDRWVVSSGEHDRWTRLDAFGHADLDRRLVPVQGGWSWRRPCDESIREWVNDRDEYRLAGLDLSGGAVVDVGAHVGSFARAARARGATVVHCYEPQADNAACLRANAQSLGGVTAFPLAVGDGSRGVVSPGSDPANTGAGRWHPEPAGAVGSVTLDAAIGRAVAAHPSGRVSVLKLDCESCEHEALANFTEWAAVDRITLEYHGGARDLPRLLADHDFGVETIPTEDNRGLIFASRQSSPG